MMSNKLIMPNQYTSIKYDYTKSNNFIHQPQSHQLLIIKLFLLLLFVLFVVELLLLNYLVSNKNSNSLFAISILLFIYLKIQIFEKYIGKLDMKNEYNTFTSQQLMDYSYDTNTVNEDENETNLSTTNSLAIKESAKILAFFYIFFIYYYLLLASFISNRQKLLIQHFHFSYKTFVLLKCKFLKILVF